MKRAILVTLSLVPLLTAGCAPLIAGGVARSRRQDADNAEALALSCWQEYRREVRARDPGQYDTQDDCERLDLQAARLGRRANRSEAAARDIANQAAANAAANRPVNCTSNQIGNSVYTNCQ